MSVMRVSKIAFAAAFCFALLNICSAGDSPNPFGDEESSPNPFAEESPKKPVSPPKPAKQASPLVEEDPFGENSPSPKQKSPSPVPKAKSPSPKAASPLAEEDPFGENSPSPKQKSPSPVPKPKSPSPPKPVAVEAPPKAKSPSPRKPEILAPPEEEASGSRSPAAVPQHAGESVAPEAAATDNLGFLEDAANQFASENKGVWKYYGCIQTHKSNRLFGRWAKFAKPLTEEIKFSDPADITPASCSKKCQEKDYEFAGVGTENKTSFASLRQCICGKSVDASGGADASKCMSRCWNKDNGEGANVGTSQVCGGAKSFSVYQSLPKWNMDIVCPKDAKFERVTSGKVHFYTDYENRVGPLLSGYPITASSGEGCARQCKNGGFVYSAYLHAPENECYCSSFLERSYSSAPPEFPKAADLYGCQLENTGARKIGTH